MSNVTNAENSVNPQKQTDEISSKEEDHLIRSTKKVKSNDLKTISEENQKGGS